MAGRRLVIGLTGKMCAGKNAAAEILAEKGFAVIDADAAAHQALEECRDKVLAEFEALGLERGIEIKNSDGSINRRALGRLLFPDKELLARQEAILFPKINEILIRFAEENKAAHTVINAPLLFKSKAAELCDFVIIITAPAAIRLFRARKRDGLSFRQILQRFSSQKGLFSQKTIKNADIVKVRNTAGRASLKKGLEATLRAKGVVTENLGGSPAV